jgi:hypothetical protein
MSTNKQKTRALILMAGLLAAAQLIFLCTPPVELAEDLGVRAELPQEIGLWQADRILYCQNSQCGWSFRESFLESGELRCPRCGSALKSMSPGEEALFPGDTVVLRRLYHGPGKSAFLATVVLAGKQRVSIHRPEICLRGQGYNVLEQEALEIGQDDRPSFTVTLLKVMSERKAGKGTMAQRQRTTRMLYWFVSAERRTHNHYIRMFHTLADRVFRGKLYRWAYITIVQNNASENNMASLLNFASRFDKAVTISDAGR